MKFKKGEWYKSPDWGTRKDYAKSNVDSDGESVIGTEKITNGIYNLGAAKWIGLRAVEVSLKEVSPFLPEGHPDKIPENAVGRWLRCISKNNWKNTLKIGDCLQITAQDSAGDFYIKGKCLVFNRLRRKEFELLPVGYTPGQEWVPAVGDWIVITKSRENWTSAMDTHAGKCVQITEIRDGEDIIWKEWDGYTWRFRQKHFRKALPHEIPGQSEPIRVKAIEPEKPLPSFKVGEVYKVTGDTIEAGNLIEITEVRSKSDIHYTTIEGKPPVTPSFSSESDFAKRLERHYRSWGTVIVTPPTPVLLSYEDEPIMFNTTVTPIKPLNQDLLTFIH